MAMPETTVRDIAIEQPASVRVFEKYGIGYCRGGPPHGACPTYRGFYLALVQFEKDLRRHVHLENNILFPRAIELEESRG